jgi:hypothetical protein
MHLTNEIQPESEILSKINFGSTSCRKYVGIDGIITSKWILKKLGGRETDLLELGGELTDSLSAGEFLEQQAAVSLPRKALQSAG